MEDKRITGKYLSKIGFEEIGRGQFRKDGINIDEAEDGYDFYIYVDSGRSIYGKVCPIKYIKQLKAVLKIFTD